MEQHVSGIRLASETETSVKVVVQTMIPEHSKDLDRMVDALIQIGLETGAVEVPGTADTALGARLIPGTRYSVDVDGLFMCALEVLLGMLPAGTLLSLVPKVIRDHGEILGRLEEPELVVYCLMRSQRDGPGAVIDLNGFRDRVVKHGSYSREQVDDALDGLADHGLIDIRTRTLRMRAL